MVDELTLWFSTTTGADIEAGRVHFHRSGPRVTTTFTIRPEYLANPNAIQFDPHIALVSGPQHFDRMPGSFQDCSPDRWGRNLIAKRSRIEARRDGQTPPSLSDIEYLAGVSDLTRQGALRFADNGRFVGDHVDVPKLVSLPALLDAADHADHADNLTAVKTLLDAGSGSLGGARPKALLLDRNDQLAIAKFPRHDDPYDIMRWEKTALDLAEHAGINTPSRRLERVGDRTVLVIDRFDRTGATTRVPYISAMTLLNAADGEPGEYGDIALSLSDIGGNVNDDLRQLFRRAAFNVAIRNTDDHLRNHGLVYQKSNGWTLSPVFDVNPNPDEGALRQTSIGGAYGIADEPDGLELFAMDCGLTGEHAEIVIGEVAEAVDSWRTTARSNGIDGGEVSMFAPAFAAGLRALSRTER